MWGRSGHERDAAAELRSHGRIFRLSERHCSALRRRAGGSVSERQTPADPDAVYPCVGICLPDADEAYCIGCGRPWGEPVVIPPAPGKSDDTATA